MHRSQIAADLERLAFDLFYWFSRFEYALKEGGYLKDGRPGDRAEPNWDTFIRRWEHGYEPSPAARALIEANPQRQVLADHGGLEFRPVRFDARVSDFCETVTLVKTVRNNLFHGGKHGHSGWDNPERMRELLPLAIAILNELANLADLMPHYRDEY